MNKTLIVIRGLPGSGKSTFARILVEPGCICTADDYFMKDGKYQWDATKIGIAHNVCIVKCERLMKMQLPTIAIANTSTTKKELKPYYDLAEKYNYKIFSIIVENRMNTKNTHNVPEETIEDMKKRFDIQL